MGNALARPVRAVAGLCEAGSSVAGLCEAGLSEAGYSAATARHCRGQSLSVSNPSRGRDDRNGVRMCQERNGPSNGGGGRECQRAIRFIRSFVSSGGIGGFGSLGDSQ